MLFLSIRFRTTLLLAPLSGMAIAPWHVLAAGKIRSDAEEGKRRESGENGRTFFGGDGERSEDQKKISQALEKFASDVGAKSLNAVAIAYVMQKTPHVFPIIGGRKVDHLMQNLEALEISLGAEQIKLLESVLPFDPGFPHKYFVSYLFAIKLLWWVVKPMLFPLFLGDG